MINNINVKDDNFKNYEIGRQEYIREITGTKKFLNSINVEYDFQDNQDKYYQRYIFNTLRNEYARLKKGTVYSLFSDILNTIKDKKEKSIFKDKCMACMLTPQDLMFIYDWVKNRYGNGFWTKKGNQWCCFHKDLETLDALNNTLIKMITCNIKEKERKQ